MNTSTISPLNHEPLYIKLKNEILKKIKEGLWMPGDKLPVEGELAEQSNVSIGTVRKAIQLLVNDGVLIKRQGAGTFVRTFKSLGYHNEFQPFSSLDGRPRYNRRKLVRFETIPTPEEIAFPLQVVPGTPIRHVVRHMVRIENRREELIAVDELFLLPSFFKKLSKSLLLEKFKESDSLYKFYDRELGIAVTNQKCTLVYEEMSEETARDLGAVTGMKVLKMCRVSMAFGRTPIGFRRTWMNVKNLQIKFDLG